MSDLVISIFVVIIFIAIAVAAKAGIGMYKCSSYAELTDRETKYTLSNGCFVKHDGKYIPRSELERRFIMDK